MPKETKKELVKRWMTRNNIGGDNPWFDPNTTYYNLTPEQIIRVANYLKTKTK